jgi:hypothetical protein
MSGIADETNFQYPPALGDLINEAVSRLETELETATPVMAGQVIPWLHYLAGQAQPEDYFKHPLAFPSLLLPWWLEETLSDRRYFPLQADLIYSTLNGYYHIRLIDNLMDHQATVELNLLPVLNFFHTQFQMTYQRYFEPRHPFWDFFRQVWFHSAEVTMQDATLTGLDETEFRQIAAQKSSAAKIPLAATCYHYKRPDLIEPWSKLVDRFGCWHQFLNDLFDWHKDSTRQVPTYFLTEAERRRQESETLMDWVIREGFSWGIEKLELWMVELRQSARQLDSPPLLDYLDVREKMLLKQRDEVAAGLGNIAKILRAKK